MTTATMEQTGTALAVKAMRDELVDCLAAVALATKARTPKAVLKCVMLTAEDGALTLRTTDLAVGIRRVARKVEVDGPGRALVDCEALLSWLRLVPDETVTLRADGDKLTLACADGTRTLNTMPADEFPPSPAAETEVMRIVAPLSAVAAAYGFVRHAVADNASRYAYHGVLFEREPKADRVNLVATEGHMLAAVGVECAVSGSASDVLIPGETVGVALRSMGDADEGAELTIGAGPSTVRFECGDATVWSLRLEGTFAPWRDVIPRDMGGKVRLERASFMDAIRRAAAATTDDSKGVAIDANPGQGLVMSARSPERGTSESRLPCKVEGAAVRIGVNPKFMLAALGGMAGDEVTFEWTVPNRPMKLTCGAMTEVVMPVNLQ